MQSMSESRYPGRYLLPEFEGELQGRFDTEEHPVLGELNLKLQMRGSYHGEPAWSISGGTVAHPQIGGDPHCLSEVLRTEAYTLASKKEPALAVKVLDEGLRWPDTRIHGEHYKEVARSAAKESNEVDIALAIVLDDRRILAGIDQEPHYVAARRESNVVRAIVTAAIFLPRALAVYRSVRQSQTQADASLTNAFWRKVDMHTNIVVGSSINGVLPYTPQPDFAMVTTYHMLSKAREGFYSIDKRARAIRLAQADPRIQSAGWSGAYEESIL
jgi:hypothetical protein